MRAVMGPERGAGDEAADVESERGANEPAIERGVGRAERKTEAAEEDEAAEGVTSVERKAVKRGEEWTETGSSSRIFEGTSL
jgi:hypothetical protein